MQCIAKRAIGISTLTNYLSEYLYNATCASRGGGDLLWRPVYKKRFKKKICFHLESFLISLINSKMFKGSLSK